jgi:RES domain-containing protein
MIHIIRSRATKQQMEEMLQTLSTYIKLAVDIQRGILAGGGVLHADCESALLEDGSNQEDIWGADWNPFSQQVTFEALINIRPRQNNPSLEILDLTIRKRVAEITHQLLRNI